MINKILFTSVLVLFIFSLSWAQNFQMEYFRFADFSTVTKMRHADFNGDGLPDFILEASNFGILQVGINTGISAPDFNEITDIRSIQKTVVEDIDRDGDFDIIGLNQFDGVFAFINDGSGVFETQQLDIENYSSIVFMDITGDGSIEMVVGSFDLTIYQINSTTLDFTEIYADDFGLGDIGAIASVDFQNDGMQDLVISTESDGLFLLEQTEPLVFESTLFYPDNYDVDDISIVNLTDDNIIDFILYSDDDKRGKIVFSDTNGQYIEESIASDEINNSLVLVGDLNKDSKEELISFEFTDSNDPAMYIKEFNDGLQDILIVQDHFGSLGGGVVDIDNDGDEDFYFFQEVISRPGLVFYLNEGVSSTHEIANTAVHIYPNPATEIINIDFDAPLNFKVNLYDLKGVLVEKFSNTSLIDVNSIPSGTYLLEIQDLDSAQEIVEKIVIER